MQEFGPHDAKDTAEGEGINRFLVNTQKGKTVEAHLTALEDPDISEDKCHHHFFALRVLARDLGLELRREILFEVVSRMWVRRNSNDIPPEIAVHIQTFVEDMGEKFQEES